MKFTRYAVYYTPPQGPLARFGAQWLGWDPVAGVESGADWPGLPLPRATLTEAPRKYGLHATLKAPFRLAEGLTPDTLIAAVEALAATRPPVTLQGLRLAPIAGFLALLPDGDATGLNALAAAVVAGLDTHRAPISAQDLARRRAAGLDARQEALVARWGYPHVMDQFRFHITLTGRIDATTAEAVAGVLAPLLAPCLPRPFIIGDLTVSAEAGDGRFHTLHRVALSG